MHLPSVLTSLVLAPAVPMAAVAAYPQVPGLEEAPTAPGWVAVFLLGVWVTLWLLDRVGKLPGAPDPRGAPFVVVDADDLRELLDDPRTQVEKIHEIVTREDVDRPGYFMVWGASRERRDIERSLQELHRKVDNLSSGRPE